MAAKIKDEIIKRTKEFWKLASGRYRHGLPVAALLALALVLIIIIRIADRAPETGRRVEIETMAETEYPARAELKDAAGADSVETEAGTEDAEEAESEETAETDAAEKYVSDRMTYDSPSQLCKLAEKYMDARVAADAEAIDEIYGIPAGDGRDDEVNRLIQNSKYIQRVDNVHTYALEGPEDGTWLCFIRSDMYFFGADTAAPVINWTFAGCEGDKYYFTDPDRLTEAEREFYAEACQYDEVKSLVADTNAALREALAADEELLKTYGTVCAGSKMYEWENIDADVVIAGSEELPQDVDGTE